MHRRASGIAFAEEATVETGYEIIVRLAYAALLGIGILLIVLFLAWAASQLR